MKKQIWHCNFCGRDGEFGDGRCQGCGNDLLMYGNVVDGTKRLPGAKKTALKIVIITALVVLVALTVICFIIGDNSSDTTETDEKKGAATETSGGGKASLLVTSPSGSTDSPNRGDSYTVTDVAIKIPDALYVYDQSSDIWDAYMFVGQSVECEIEYSYSGVLTGDLSGEFTSSDSSVLSANGFVINAKKEGNATLTAIVEGVRTTLTVYIGSMAVADAAVAMTPDPLEINPNRQSTYSAVALIGISESVDLNSLEWDLLFDDAAVSYSYESTEYAYNEQGVDVYSSDILLTVTPANLNPFNDVYAVIVLYYSNSNQIVAYEFLRYTA